MDSLGSTRCELSRRFLTRGEVCRPLLVLRWNGSVSSVARRAKETRGCQPSPNWPFQPSKECLGWLRAISAASVSHFW